MTSTRPPAHLLDQSIHRSEAIEVVADEQASIRIAQRTPISMHLQATLYPIPARSLREERLKDIHLKPDHESVKGEEGNTAGEPTLPWQ